MDQTYPTIQLMEQTFCKDIRLYDLPFISPNIRESNSFKSINISSL